MKTILIQPSLPIASEPMSRCAKLCSPSMSAAPPRAPISSTPTGRCLGHGRNRGGNPASNNPDFAASSIISAVEAAVAEAGGGPFDIIVAQIALAGTAGACRAGEARDGIPRGSGSAGRSFSPATCWRCSPRSPSRRTAIASSPEPGAGAIRIRGGEIDRVVDLAGWQLGDLGSGYWLGHEAAKAAVAEMEGRGPATALTPALLEAMNIANAGDGHARAVDAAAAVHRRDLCPAPHRARPLCAAGHRASATDPVAAQLLEEAERYLAHRLRDRVRCRRCRARSCWAAA